jgi:protein disulfide-isomerase/protein disulfide-isomerase A1
MRCLWLLALGAASASEVKVLTKDNFDSVIKENKNVLVKFYAPWCGHCKAMVPEYEKAAAKVEGAVLAKVDATVETELGKRFSVQGYPTLKWFSDGVESEYDGGRTGDTILEWIKGMTGPAVTEGAPPTEAKKPIVVQYGDALDEKFKKAAEKFRREALWHFVEGAEKKATIQHPNEPAIETTDFSDLAKFFEDNKFPLFGNLDGDSFTKYTSRGIGLVWVLLPMKKGEVEEKAATVRDEMMKVATEFKDFSITYTDTDSFKDAVSSMLGVTEFPRVAVQNKPGDKKKFIYDGEITAAAVSKFIQDVKDGKIEPKLKSEKPPATNDGPVKVIVGSELQSMLFSDTYDALFEVYAPWCGHCKKLEPEYEKIGKKVKKEGLDDILMIAKMDGTQNDPPVDSMEWSGFPTMFYIKAGNKTPIKYEGERTAKGMWKWLKKEHSKAAELKAKLAENKKKKKEEL